MVEQPGLVCHTANLKDRAVKGIIQGSKFNPKLAKHAQCAVLHCFKSLFTQREQRCHHQHEQHAVKNQSKQHYLQQVCAQQSVALPLLIWSHRRLVQSMLTPSVDRS